MTCPGGRTAVIVGASGSGGHIFPALSYIEGLAKSGAALDVYIVTGRKKIEEEILGDFDRSRLLQLGLRPYQGAKSLLSPAFLASLVGGFWKSLGLMRSLRPKLVVGFGGFPTLPLILSARAAGVKTLIHEQNADFGLANRFLSGFVTRAALAFPSERSGKPFDSAQGKPFGFAQGKPFGFAQGKVFTSGMPMRPGLRKIDPAEARKQLGLDPNRMTLAIVGGSQGSRALNEAVKGFLRGHAEGILDRWQFVHLTGQPDFEGIKSFYAASEARHKVFSFFKDMSIIYSGADLVLCRAGAVTLHELAFFGKCALLVPYPEARGHQLQNARVLSENGAAFLVEQDKLDAGEIGRVLAAAESEPGRLAEMGRKAAALLNTNGSGELVKESLNLIKGANGQSH